MLLEALIMLKGWSRTNNFYSFYLYYFIIFLLLLKLFLRFSNIEAPSFLSKMLRRLPSCFLILFFTHSLTVLLLSQNFKSLKRLLHLPPEILIWFYLVFMKSLKHTWIVYHQHLHHLNFLILFDELILDQHIGFFHLLKSNFINLY